MEQPVASTAVAPRGSVSPAPAVRPTSGLALLQTATGKSQQPRSPASWNNASYDRILN